MQPASSHTGATTPRGKLLLFGGTGAIGSAIHHFFAARNWDVCVVTRQASARPGHISWDPLSAEDASATTQLEQHAPFDAICWAQGLNCSDSIYDFSIENNEKLYRANILFILKSLQILLNENALKTQCRLTVISSIWQNMARQNKLSYCITKSALEGLVLSLAADLAKDGHIINAVLPGVIDTPMTRANLTPEQVKRIEESTFFGRLPKLEEVSACVYSLSQPEATGITGQFINVDLGYSNVRII